MTDTLAVIRSGVRSQARVVAQWLNQISGGRVTPTMVTVFGFAMHVPIALLIATRHWLWAAGFLVVFGLFDVLDGGLARVQGTASRRGMVLDASTDRMKEVLLYSGAAYALIIVNPAAPERAVWAVVACGASLCVSYVKAKGEAAVASASGKKGKDAKREKPIPHDVLNKMFADGLLTFEIRMAVLVAGLIFDQLYYAILVIAILASFTAVQRLVRISKYL